MTATHVPFGRRFKRLLGALGPGVTTGAADDDPSGIATYSVVGSQFGTTFLWASLLTWPLMGCVQMMCARIGMVTGMGLAGALRQKFPRALVGLISLALLGANAINIGSDLSGMADAAQMLGWGPAHLYVALFGVGICVLTVWFSYERIARILRWLALSLFAYVATAFLTQPHWGQVLHDSFVPSVPASKEGWGALVAILGTTISPYLFFWQAGQEVEEEKAKGRISLAQRRGASRRELVDRGLDVGLGTLFSNVVMYFIILTAASTLFRHGIKAETTKQVAESLRPLAGNGAEMLYALGLIATGLLAIPSLAGSAAYAFAETFDWTYGLNEKLRDAVPFYGVFAAATAIGMVLDFAHVNPIKALYWTALLNGLLAPFLLIALLFIATDHKIMRGQVSPIGSRWIVALTTLLMFAAGTAMFVL